LRALLHQCCLLQLGQQRGAGRAAGRRSLRRGQRPAAEWQLLGGCRRLVQLREQRRAVLLPLVHVKAAVRGCWLLRCYWSAAGRARELIRGGDAVHLGHLRKSIFCSISLKDLEQCGPRCLARALLGSI
jgi:hypothetical protein